MTGLPRLHHAFFGGVIGVALMVGCKPVANAPSDNAKNGASNPPAQGAVAAEKSVANASESGASPVAPSAPQSSQPQATKPVAMEPAATIGPNDSASGGASSASTEPIPDVHANSQEQPNGEAVAQPDAPEMAADAQHSNDAAGANAAGKPNHLLNETSPYLLQHAQNPVDWYPWGPEALEKARKEGKLIFLSVGYSSCHWCHVMERESFMDPAIAQLLNTHFVCIKVDREERPDIDDVYMTALQIYYQLAGSPQSGGWPLSMFLTPNAEPLLGGTYFPSNDFQRMLETLAARWTEDSETLSKLGGKMAEAVAETLTARAQGDHPRLDRELTSATQKALVGVFDKEYGGFGFSELDPTRPKFPEPQNLMFLLNRAEQDIGDTESRAILLKTLETMAAGGIWDHLGGGFHRYSTDRKWEIPHFEKMLYDNGQLASVYARAAVLLNRPDFAEVANQTAAFMTRELRDQDGGLFASLDAETEGIEGRYYVWSPEELTAALNEPQRIALQIHFGLGEAPNFEGRYYLLTRSQSLRAVTPADVNSDALDAALDKLWQVRTSKTRPNLDNKILTAWNGLAIRGLADTGRLLNNAEAVQAGEAAAQFALSKLRGKEGRLVHNITSGEVNTLAFLDDYAYMIQGLLALEQATGKEEFLVAATELQTLQNELFWDEQAGGYYFTPVDGETVIVRSKNMNDGPMPCGNAVSASNLIALSTRLSRPEWLAMAEKTLLSGSAMLEKTPVALPSLALAMDEYLDAAPSGGAGE